MLAIVKVKILEIKEKEQEKSSVAIFYSTVTELWKGLFRILIAKFYLRNFTKVGQLVSTNGRPLVENKGKIIVGNRVRIWSNIIKSKIYVSKNAIFEVGDNSRINGVHISVSKKVIIGRNVRISPYSLILDDDFHKIDDHFGVGKKMDIIIEDNVWIASKVTILKGVTIGEGSVIAAGAVVTKSIPPYTVAAGVPAKVIKEIK